MCVVYELVRGVCVPSVCIYVCRCGDVRVSV